jgi:hypothetical protein
MQRWIGRNGEEHLGKISMASFVGESVQSC